MASVARSSLVRQLIVKSTAQRSVSSSTRSTTTNAPMRTQPLLQTKSLAKCTPLPSRAAAFHTTRRREILPPLPQRLSGTANEAAPVPPGDSMHGNYHWTAERVVSVALIPVTVAPFMGASMTPVVDSILAGLLIVHSHMGFQSIITDYLPSRRVPKSRKTLDWMATLGALTVAYGCYEFETNDVGLVEGAKKLWHA